MSGIVRAPWPTGIRKTVVHVLLNVIDHALFEISFVIREQTNAGRSHFDNGLVAHVRARRLFAASGK
jgi:hypothetical protein